MTYLEFLVWNRWLDERWNDPDLHCYYMMQVAAEIRAGFSKNPQPVRLSQLKIPFEMKQPGEDEIPLTDAEAKRIEAIWMAKLGLLGGGQKQGREIARQKREPGPQHDARNKQRGLTPNAGTVPVPRHGGKRGGGASNKPVYRGVGGEVAPEPPVGGKRSRPPRPTPRRGSDKEG
jgi:hypothetical protein